MFTLASLLHLLKEWWFFIITQRVISQKLSRSKGLLCTFYEFATVTVSPLLLLHGELSDDLTNISQQAHGVSCKLTEGSQQCHSVSHIVSSLWVSCLSSNWFHCEIIQVSSLWVCCKLTPSQAGSSHLNLQKAHLDCI